MIGIDLGTTQSKSAYLNPTGRPTAILNDRGQQQTPSVIFVPETGECLVGADAREQGYVEPERCLANFKLALGSNENLLSNGRVITPTDAATILLKNIKGWAEQAVGRAVTEVVVTCPANSKDDFKQALTEANNRTGLEVLSLIPEPTAAGIAYAFNKASRDSLVAVYDFGGGTLDVTLMNVQGPQIKVLATDGIPKLGGNDLNEPIHFRFLDEIKKKFGEEPSRTTEPLLFQELDAKAEAAKISLGKRPNVPCVVGYRGSQVVVELTQEGYHKDIEPMIRQSLESLDRAVQAAGLEYGSIDHLLMVGGTSRMPYIQQLLAQHTGLTPRMDIDPEKAIAYGAALACIDQMAKKGQTATIHGRVIPAPEMFIRDVAAHGVGCCVSDAIESGQKLVNEVIIPKNTPIPCQKMDSFLLEHEQQTEARIEILQGKPDADRDDCLIIGEIVLEDLPKESTRTQRIQVEYMIDSNGMVTATATDKVSGKNKTVSVDYKKGIKPKKKPASI